MCAVHTDTDITVCEILYGNRVPSRHNLTLLESATLKQSRQSDFHFASQHSGRRTTSPVHKPHSLQVCECAMCAVCAMCVLGAVAACVCCAVAWCVRVRLRMCVCVFLGWLCGCV